MIIHLLQNPIVLVALIIWTLVWKGLALWKAARAHQKAWFIAMLIVNTIGILDILYLYVFSNKTTAPEIE